MSTCHIYSSEDYVPLCKRPSIDPRPPATTTVPNGAIIAGAAPPSTSSAAVQSPFWSSKPPMSPYEFGHVSSCDFAGSDQMQNGSSDNIQFAELLLQREQSLSHWPARLAQGEGVIGWADRDREAFWICGAARRLGLDTDSISAAIALLDRVVCSTRVPPKYINCVAAACLHISKKLCEDNEETTTNFLRRLRLEYSPSEMKRMETRILALLQWDVQLPTLSRFLDAMMSPLRAQYLIGPIRCHLEAVLCSSQIMSQFRPSVVALSLVSLVLEATRRHWLRSSHHIIKTFKVEMGELIRCREKVSSLWDRSFMPSFSSYGLLASTYASFSNQANYEHIQVSTTNETCAFSSATPSTPITPDNMTSPQALQPTPC
ncbi:unnamed protein product [Auanema sp. JU1783]|nr:unnamed protein product [Auanema sp. JU1783]